MFKAIISRESVFLLCRAGRRCSSGWTRQSAIHNGME